MGTRCDAARLKQAFAVAATLAGVACTAWTRGAPGAGVTPEVAAPWGCRADSVAALARSVPKELVPEPGWTACQLLAAHGRPDRVEQVATAGAAAAAYWWWDYPPPVSEARMALLRDTASGWRVESVVW